MMNSVIKIITEKFENRQWHEKIRLLRSVHDWSIKEVAEKCITTEKCVWSWEAGRSVPSKRNKKIIASVLGVEEETIFE
jgi:ribosome-binding protein aMBF1 (putative translation factor)